MEERVRGQLPELESVMKKKISQEFVGMKGKTTKQICQENNGKARWRIGTSIRTWGYDGVWVISDQPQLDSTVLISRADGRSGPIPLRFFKGGGARCPWSRWRLSSASGGAQSTWLYRVPLLHHFDGGGVGQ